MADKTISIQVYEEHLDDAKTLLPQDASTFMHLDFQNKHQTELETLSGYIVKEAKQHNLVVPLMEKFYKILKKSSKIYPMNWS